ncbi:MAG: hypothetical protein J5I47_02080 [Vicingus serpentipes]|nr:hypothetical protein [Vicingus serpentipes]
MVILKKIILFSLFWLFHLAAFAQCAMCKAVAESDLAAGGETAKGINGGIIYLMFIPYLLIVVVGYFIYKHYKQNKLKSAP